MFPVWRARSPGEGQPTVRTVFCSMQDIFHLMLCLQSRRGIADEHVFHALIHRVSRAAQESDEPARIPFTDAVAGDGREAQLVCRYPCRIGRPIFRGPCRRIPAREKWTPLLAGHMVLSSTRVITGWSWVVGILRCGQCHVRLPERRDDSNSGSC